MKSLDLEVEAKSNCSVSMELVLNASRPRGMTAVLNFISRKLFVTIPTVNHQFQFIMPPFQNLLVIARFSTLVFMSIPVK